MRRFPLLVLATLLAAAACGGDSSADTTAAVTSTSQQTTIQDAPDLPTITFDGSSCTYAGPEAIPAGMQEYRFVNESTETAIAYAFEIKPTSTVEDLLAHGRPIGGDRSVWPEWPPPSTSGHYNLSAEAGETVQGTTGMVGGDVLIECSTVEYLPFGPAIAWFTGPHLPGSPG